MGIVNKFFAFFSFFSISNCFPHFYMQQDNINKLAKESKKDIQKQAMTQKQDLVTFENGKDYTKL